MGSLRVLKSTFGSPQFSFFTLTLQINPNVLYDQRNNYAGLIKFRCLSSDKSQPQ